MLKDSFGRKVNYLRLSVTDRCNLRCFYCWPRKFVRFIPHEDILRYEEILRLMKVGRSLGVEKIRLTGGEPFVRRDFIPFLERAVAQNKELDLRLTTNGTLLSGKVARLKEMGLTRLNISLDTLDRSTYERLTGHDLFMTVRNVVDECLAHSIQVKLNAVALKSVNEPDLAGFLDWARRDPIEIRFIEFMPVGGKTIWDRDYFWSARDILARARDLARLNPVENRDKTSGPATVFTVEGGKGRFGVISAVSNHFCGTCNRLRITPDGRLRTCLFSEKEYRLRPILRSPRLTDNNLARVMVLANRKKPLGHEELKRKKGQQECTRNMFAIGG